MNGDLRAWDSSHCPRAGGHTCALPPGGDTAVPTPGADNAVITSALLARLSGDLQRRLGLPVSGVTLRSESAGKQTRLYTDFTLTTKLNKNSEMKNLFISTITNTDLKITTKIIF